MCLGLEPIGELLFLNRVNFRMIYTRIFGFERKTSWLDVNIHLREILKIFVLGSKEDIIIIIFKYNDLHLIVNVRIRNYFY